MNLQESIRKDLDRFEALDASIVTEEQSKIYNVKVTSSHIGYVEITAESEDEAIDEALQYAYKYSVDYHPEEDITAEIVNDDSINEATGSTSEDEIIELLNNKFPGCNAVSTEEWDGRAGGIWFRGTESCEIDDLPLYNQEVFADTMGVNPKLEKILSYHGWYSEPYDSGTLMAYPV